MQTRARTRPISQNSHRILKTDSKRVYSFKMHR